MRKLKVAAYKPHRDDPTALTRKCPACGAKVGFWCSGGAGDVHLEREKARDPKKVARPEPEEES